MKIRNGFVSNSSTCSFLIYGIKIYETDIDSENKQELRKNELDWIYGQYDDIIYVGKSWDKVGDNQTGKQFKEDIENKIKSIFGDDVNFGTFEDAWYDG